MRDAEGSLASFLPREHTIAMLIRPDRYVAAAADPERLPALAQGWRDLLRATAEA